MTTTRERRRMINDAKRLGMIVAESATGCVIKRGPRSAGIILWPNGTATRTDVDLQAATAIRTVKAMRGVLGMKD